ncbi:DotU family type IV/VI secretion system protein [Sulfurimonas lithotrophica]|uniref:DotU family type IV/VI secretion system protein n=1 Tax=Sulfurimonas lithotrophica TaxID=2590022 RepID=A0A5P8P014_9BACT|nr:type IVB secretion system protein IcmH/DotU [Sulfurimonas lithotrophica]QFR48940.1 DotU family type IV/VI secretion system protein [Sulfurimonas lithotrophica]
MSSTTLLIPSSENKTNLTNFDKHKEENYSTFKDKTLSFVRNTKKTHIPYYDEDMNYFLLASSSIFQQLSIVQNNYDVGPIFEVRQSFIDSINEYTEMLMQYNVEESQALVSRYILCTFVDELINTTHFGQENNWSSNSMLRIFHNESYGGQNFFKLLDKFLKAPAKFIYILELMYVCLSLGFHGKYRVDNSNKQELNMIRESLYKQIKIIQGREPLKFYTKHEPSTLKHRLFYITSYTSIALISLLVLIIVYTGLSFGIFNEDQKFFTTIEKSLSSKYLTAKNFNLEKYKKEYIND